LLKKLTILFSLLLLNTNTAIAHVITLNDFQLTQIQKYDLNNIIKKSKTLIDDTNTPHKIKVDQNSNLTRMEFNNPNYNIPFTFSIGDDIPNLDGFYISEVSFTKEILLEGIYLKSLKNIDWSLTIEFNPMVLFDYRVQGFLLSVIGENQTYYIQITNSYDVINATVVLH